jgi:hypothetical protein
MYEDAEDGGLSSHIPFIQVPVENEMPKVIFIFESRDTGDFEPGLEGEEVPVVQLDLHQYADMSILKEGLSLETYDAVRECLGLEKMSSAVTKGKKITESVRNNLS